MVVVAAVILVIITIIVHQKRERPGIKSYNDDSIVVDQKKS